VDGARARGGGGVSGVRKVVACRFQTVFCCVCVNEWTVEKEGSPRRGLKSGEERCGCAGRAGKGRGRGAPCQA
jgi:hypothetical protein